MASPLELAQLQDHAYLTVRGKTNAPPPAGWIRVTAA